MCLTFNKLVCIEVRCKGPNEEAFPLIAARELGLHISIVISNNGKYDEDSHDDENDDNDDYKITFASLRSFYFLAFLIY